MPFSSVCVSAVPAYCSLHSLFYLCFLYCYFSPRSLYFFCAMFFCIFLFLCFFCVFLLHLSFSVFLLRLSFASFFAVFLCRLSLLPFFYLFLFRLSLLSFRHFLRHFLIFSSAFRLFIFCVSVFSAVFFFLPSIIPHKPRFVQENLLQTHYNKTFRRFSPSKSTKFQFLFWIIR